MKYSFIILFLFSLFSWSPQSNTELNIAPDTGIKPIEIRTLTNTKKAHLIHDNNPNSFWESEALLPTAWLTLNGINHFLNRQKSLTNITQYSKPGSAFDGNLDSALDVKSGRLEFKLLPQRKAGSILWKFGASADVEIQVFNPQSKVIFAKSYSKDESYKALKINELKGDLGKILISSSKSFQLFELAHREGLLKERVLLDFGKNIKIEYLALNDNRFENSVEKLSIYTYKNKEQKELTKYENVRNDLVKFDSEKSARFVLLEYTPKQANWQKIRISDIKAYDKNGVSGAKPGTQASTMPLKDLIGINGYWGFGHNQYSKFIPPGEGPDAYTPFISHIRTYHDMTWDIKDPDDFIDYDLMSIGKGTPAKEWVNWDLEYKDWQKNGVDIQASLQFFRFKDADWDKPYQSAYNYAYAFARHFGITHGNGTICSIEIGNEPWKYDAKIYQKILAGMANGAKAGDPKMEVFPCALQATDPTVEEKDGFKNYINARITPEVLPLLDGVNVHHYSYNSHNTYTQKALQPESAGSVFWEILDAIKWRNTHLPGKKIFLSEWGWDSAGGGEDCTHNQCVREQDAAAFAIRGALIAHRLGVDRATWFYYGNESGESRLYARSGLTSSVEKGFQKKKTYYAFDHLIKLLGDKHFIKVYKEQNDYWGYYYGDSNGKATQLVLWRPVMNDDKKIKVNLPASLDVKSASVFSFAEGESLEEIEVLRGENGAEILVGSVPVVVVL